MERYINGEKYEQTTFLKEDQLSILLMDKDHYESRRILHQESTNCELREWNNAVSDTSVFK